MCACRSKWRVSALHSLTFVVCGARASPGYYRPDTARAKPPRQQYNWQFATMNDPPTTGSDARRWGPGGVGQPYTHILHSYSCIKIDFSVF